MPASEPTSPVVAKAVQHTSRQADFMRLLLQHEQQIFRCVIALVPSVADAQEVVQETAIALWQKYDDYDGTRPFSAWACGFAVIEAKAYLRRHKRWRSFLNEELAEALVRRRAELYSELDERLSHLRSCLQRLPTQQRALIEGYYFAGTSVERLSAISGKTADAVYKTMQRIRQVLLECITRKARVEEPAA